MVTTFARQAAREPLIGVPPRSWVAQRPTYVRNEDLKPRHSSFVELTIQDNGRVFDPAKIVLGQLGLSIMNDRIQSIGDTLETISKKNDGTLIKVSYDAPTDRKAI